MPCTIGHAFRRRYRRGAAARRRLHGPRALTAPAGAGVTVALLGNERPGISGILTSQIEKEQTSVRAYGWFAASASK
jgi:hypothetical protein